MSSIKTLATVNVAKYKALEVFHDGAAPLDVGIVLKGFGLEVRERITTVQAEIIANGLLDAVRATKVATA